MAMTPGAGVTQPREDLLTSWMERSAEEPRWAGDRILTPFQVRKRRGEMGVIPRETFLGLHDTKRKPKSESGTSDWDPEDDSFKLLEYSWKEFVAKPDKEDYEEWMDLEDIAVKRCRYNIMRDYERDVANLVFSTSTFPSSGNTGVSLSTQWDDSGGTPVSDVLTAIEAIEDEYGVGDLYIALTSKARRKVMLNAEVRAALTDTYGAVKPAMITDEQLAVILGLGGVTTIYADSNIYNAANAGQAFTAGKVFSDDRALIYKPGMGRELSMPQLGRTFGLAGEENVAIESWDEPDPKGRWIKCSMTRQAKLSPAPVGYLIDNILN